MADNEHGTRAGAPYVAQSRCRAGGHWLPCGGLRGDAPNRKRNDYKKCSEPGTAASSHACLLLKIRHLPSTSGYVPPVCVWRSSQISWRRPFLLPDSPCLFPTMQSATVTVGGVICQENNDQNSGFFCDLATRSPEGKRVCGPRSARGQALRREVPSPSLQSRASPFVVHPQGHPIM